MDKEQKPKHSKTSKRIIAFVIVSIFVFTGVAIYVPFMTGNNIPDALIVAFYAFCTGELWMLASIKKTKISMGQKDNEYQLIEKIKEMVNNNEDDDEPPVG